jgi:hypothetical protein
MAINVLSDSPLFCPDNFPNHLSHSVLKPLNIHLLIMHSETIQDDTHDCKQNTKIEQF